MAYNPFRNFGLKAVAVGIATLLWVAVGGEKIVERSLRAPLELENRSEDLEPVGDTPDTVDVRVRGSSSALGRLSPGDVTAVLDVSTARQGRNLFPLAPTSVRAPFGVEVSSVAPATVPLAFERLLIKKVPVVPQIEGEPAPGHERRRVTVEPAEVEVEGPESAIRDLEFATTEPIKLGAAAVGIQTTVAIGVLNSAARLRHPQRAMVTIDIQPVRTERTLGAVPVRMRELGAGRQAQSTPPSVAVTLRGDEGALKGLGAGAIEAWVDLTGLGAGRYTLDVQIAPSRLYGVVRIVPRQVELTIK